MHRSFTDGECPNDPKGYKTTGRKRGKVMKTLQKFLVILMMTVMMASVLAGCGKKGECEDCGQVEKLNEYVDEDGESHWYCDDCYRMEKLFSDT